MDCCGWWDIAAVRAVAFGTFWLVDCGWWDIATGGVLAGGIVVAGGRSVVVAGEPSVVAGLGSMFIVE